MVPADDFGFAEGGVLVPLKGTLGRGMKHALPGGTYVEKVDLLQQLLLMVLEFSDHVSGGVISELKDREERAWGKSPRMRRAMNAGAIADH